MLDRASTFANPKIVEMLKTEFVPVAIDQANQRRQQDTEGDFYRQIAGQGPRNDFDATTQGFYIATSDGDLLLYNNNRDPEKIRGLMQQRLAEFKESRTGSQPDGKQLTAERVDSRYNESPPEGGLVLRVRAKVLDGYEPTTNRWQQIFQSALSRDNLWVSAAEQQALVHGKVPDSLARRIARFHLVDNTRGEPPFWKSSDIQQSAMTIDKGVVRGKFRLRNRTGDRGYDASSYGIVETSDGKVTKLEFVVRGDFWGEGAYTGGAPEGKFPLAISFTLADGSDIADDLPPQGSRGWLAGYLK